MEHPVARELRFIRVYLIILIIVIAFWDREKTVEITDHGSDPILNTSNMTQVGEYAFAYKDESNQIKIFKFNPDTNEIKLIKEFYANEYELHTINNSNR
ncbi:TPA: YmzC family protein [Bacillus thuringiensis]|nr:YmzC family protein [Bacillus cereus]HDR4766801.1 YmzC family protein [Bacillus cereus]HDR4795945.1 YmzC family protein [Bacillus cereus]HDR4799931.1 YmzC family protein [Bacillus cereus]HDR4801249.1 YmzC family protein [Bacillus cereus]